MLSAQVMLWVSEGPYNHSIAPNEMYVHVSCSIFGQDMCNIVACSRLKRAKKVVCPIRLEFYATDLPLRLHILSYTWYLSCIYGQYQHSV